MKRSVFIISCVLFMVMFVVLNGYKSEAAPPPAKTEVEKLYELAKKEGEISFSSPTTRQPVAKLFEVFSRKYPGLKLEYVAQDASEALPRLIAEEAAGRNSLDVFLTSTAVMPTLEERDMLAQYDWNRIFGIRKELIKNEGRALLWHHIAQTIIYNTNLVAPADVPKSYEDLLNPKFKGIIGIELKMTNFAYQAMAIGEERVIDLARKLKAQKPLFIKSNNAIVDRLVAGEVAISLGGFLDKVYWYQDKGAPVDWARVSPLIVIPRHLSVMKKAPHPSAARLWAAWLLTSEALELFEKLEYRSLLAIGSTSRQWKAIQEANVKTWAMPSTQEAEERNVALMTEFGKILGTR